MYIILGSVSYSTHEFPANSSIGSGGRAVHERSHSDTPTPLPSVDLSVESSSVTSLSNLPLRKNIASGKIHFTLVFLTVITISRHKT